MLNMNKEEIKQEQNKGLKARILGGTPTTFLHKAFFVLHGIFSDTIPIGILCFHILL